MNRKKDPFLFYSQLFNSQDKLLKTLATSSSLTEDSKSFFSCVKKGEEAYWKFVI